MIEVRRLRKVHGTLRGEATLAQSFAFENTKAQRLADTLWTSPLIGPESVFGTQTRAAGGGDESHRSLRDFSPAPTFSFDVEMTRPEALVFVVAFSQPRRSVPYLEGEIAWLFRDEEGRAVLDEEINTERAFEWVSKPLTGPRRSLRRWAFFRVGHAQVMINATRNLAHLVG